jgi:hypothetical protein
MMASLASVLAVLVWPALIAFVVWRLERPVGALLEALTTRTRGGGGTSS